MKKYARLAAFILAVLMLLPAAGAIAESTTLTLTGGGTQPSGQEDDPSGADGDGTSPDADPSADRPEAGPAGTGSAPADGGGVKYVALTFDDGPSSSNTAGTLDMLKKYGVRATFFVVGNRIKGNEALLRRMADEGHEIGNHSYDHKRFTNLTGAQIEDQLLRTNALVYAACGVKVTLARPPYGARNARMLEIFRELGLACVVWSIDPEDWNSTSAKGISDHVVKRAANGSVILLHDLRKTSVGAAERIIQALLAKGYRFVTVSELFGGKLEAGAVYRGRAGK